SSRGNFKATARSRRRNCIANLCTSKPFISVNAVTNEHAKIDNLWERRLPACHSRHLAARGFFRQGCRKVQARCLRSQIKFANRLVMNFKLRVWRQQDRQSPGELVDYEARDISPNASFLEMLDVVNEQLVLRGETPIAFDSDCR